MRHKTLILLITVITGTILSSCSPSPKFDSVITPTASDTTVQVAQPDQIQDSTILILVQSGANFNDMELGHGIGTLVEHQEGAYVVTHNHWGDVFENDLATVELRDASNHMIVPMYASAFKDLIVYQDPGTLVLRAVPELLERVRPAEIGNTTALEVGTHLQVAYRLGSERSSVTVFEAEIVQFSAFEGEPIIEVHSRDGNGLQKGDSGGGVWYDGKLVGNTWAILVAKSMDTSSKSGQLAPSVSGESYIAILPALSPSFPQDAPSPSSYATASSSGMALHPRKAQDYVFHPNTSPLRPTNKDIFKINHTRSGAL